MSTIAARRGPQVIGNADQHQETETIDFKMVTFALAGKDYAVDIMKVKEIAKFGGFTYVPNTQAFVRGVYNLRGDIISVIDLRGMFHLPVPEKQAEMEDGLILRYEGGLIGVVVDRIDRVVGISRSRIQPPHPIFGDINIRYISGVVEHDNALYIILDVERIFGREQAENQARQLPASPASQAASPARDSAPAGQSRTAGPASARIPTAARADDGDLDYRFIAEQLATLGGFFVSPVNQAWVQNRFVAWKQDRVAAGKDVQLRSEDDARLFLRGFSSAASGTLWPEDMVEELQGILSQANRSHCKIWNPGCGQGHETYSVSVAARRAFQNAVIRVWASDNDIVRISEAKTLSFQGSAIPEVYRPYTVARDDAWTFASAIKDLITFEYSDIAHAGSVPQVDLVVARDILSQLALPTQEEVLDRFAELLPTGGLLIIGDHESLAGSPLWKRVGDGQLSAYFKV